MKFGLEEELIMWIMKTSITQIWMVCHLLPFAKVGQYAFKHSETLLGKTKTKNDIRSIFRGIFWIRHGFHIYIHVTCLLHEQIHGRIALEDYLLLYSGGWDNSSTIPPPPPPATNNRLPRGYSLKILSSLYFYSLGSDVSDHLFWSEYRMNRTRFH